MKTKMIHSWLDEMVPMAERKNSRCFFNFFQTIPVCFGKKVQGETKVDELERRWIAIEKEGKNKKECLKEMKELLKETEELIPVGNRVFSVRKN